MSDRAIGVIGGSGLYEIESLASPRQVSVETPFGAPSDDFVVGQMHGRRVVFLARHGRQHTLLPSELNYRANIYAFKKLGVDWLISISAVGSMREEIAPGEMVIVDQFIDRTKSRANTFFGKGVVGHVQFADPVCGVLARTLHSAAQTVNAKAHLGGTYICIEGPQFSTRAESLLYRSWGVDVIGMTNVPECQLAREAGICYSTLAMATDYDCWHDRHDDVSVESVVKILKQNVDTARRIVDEAVRSLDPGKPCGHREAGRQAVLTPAEAMDPKTRDMLAVLFEETARPQ